MRSQSLSFSSEIASVLYAAEHNPIADCIQCGTCSATCPAVDFMDHSPRQLIAMVRADQKAKVLRSNTYWCCASCYSCTVRCPANIDIAYMMYGLKRYSMWRNHHGKDLIGPDFSRRFVRMIVRNGRSWEPGLAPSYLFKRGVLAMIHEAITATALLLRGRLPLLPARIRRRRSFRAMLSRIIPIGGAA